MSDKIELNDAASGYKLSIINDNFQKIEDELNDKVLYRDNPSGTPNQMLQPLDMNGNVILNCPNLGGGGGGGGSGVASGILVTPAGNISSINVQAALQELDGEKAKLNGDVVVPFNALTQPVNTNSELVATTRFVLSQKATTIPQANGLFGVIGSSSRFALEDHVHPGVGGGGGGEITAINNGQLYAYQRSATTLTSNPGDVTYDFTVGKITSPAGDALANGWTKSIPAGTTPLYVCVASASNSNSTDTVASTEWTTPVLLVSNGISGLNIATIYLYQRAVTPVAPAVPSTTSTYNFTTLTLTGFNNGWSTTIPSAISGKYLYVTTATAASTTTTDTIPSSEWAASSLFVQDGTNGTNGTSGSNGSNGQRGTVTVAYAISGSSWSNTEANNALIAAGYYPPQNRDIVTLYNTGANFSETRFYDTGSWLTLGAYINGNLLVSGTLSADKITGGTITGVEINIGSGNFRVYNSFGTITTNAAFLTGTRLDFDNTGSPIAPTIKARVGIGSQTAIVATNQSGDIAGHGIRGQATIVSTSNVSSGLVGAANGYDFYADGAGTNYGPFTGAHDALVVKECTAEAGDIMIDVQCISKSNLSNTIFKVVPSTVPCQKAAVGIYVHSREFVDGDIPAGFVLSSDIEGNKTTTSSYSESQELYRIAAVNALGEGQINVCDEGGDIEAGDFIVTSSVPGKGMRQADDVLHNYTVAKARESVTFNPGEIKTIACIYLCG